MGARHIAQPRGRGSLADDFVAGPIWIEEVARMKRQRALGTRPQREDGASGSCHGGADSGGLCPSLSPELVRSHGCRRRPSARAVLGTIPRGIAGVPRAFSRSSVAQRSTHDSRSRVFELIALLWVLAHSSFESKGGGLLDRIPAGLYWHRGRAARGPLATDNPARLAGRGRLAPGAAPGYHLQLELGLVLRLPGPFNPGLLRNRRLRGPVCLPRSSPASPGDLPLRRTNPH